MMTYITPVLEKKHLSDTAFKHLILHNSTSVSFLSEMHIMNWSQVGFIGSLIVQM